MNSYSFVIKSLTNQLNELSILGKPREAKIYFQPTNL